MRRSWGRHSLFVGMSGPLNFEMDQRTLFQGLNVDAFQLWTTHVTWKFRYQLTQFIARVSTTFQTKSGNTFADCSRKFLDSLRQRNRKVNGSTKYSNQLGNWQIFPSFCERERDRSDESFSGGQCTRFRDTFKLRKWIWFLHFLALVSG